MKHESTASSLRRAAMRCMFKGDIHGYLIRLIHLRAVDRRRSR